MSKRVLIKNIASLSIVQIANYVLPLVSVPIITRIIGPEKFGVINYAAAFIAYFNIFITYGFDLTATRRVAKDPTNQAQTNKIFNEVLQAKLLLFSVSTALFMVCLYLIPPLRSEPKVAAFSFLFCIGTLLTQNWLFVAMQDLPKVALFEFISKLVFTLSVLAVVRTMSDYPWQPLIASMAQILVAAISLAWAVKRYRLTFIRVSFRNLIALLKSEAVIFFSLMLISLYTTTNIVILGLFQSPEQVGFYTGGQKLIIVACSIINLPLSQALFPFIGRSFATNYQEGLLTVRRLIPIIIALTGGMGIIMVVVGPWALIQFYGPAFAPSVIVFQLLAIAPLFIALSGVFGIQIMLNLNLDTLYMRITLTATIISIVANLLLVKRFGYIGTALNWLFTEVFVTTTMYVALRMKGIDPIDRQYFNLKLIRNQLQPFIRACWGIKFGFWA